ncbi:DNA replication and repair protein RecF [bacterium]|nr:DNA replication and repair protein RecF [bacterium]
MQINTLRLQNYRNHKNLELEFDPKITLIVGPNGTGKTNILESIYLLSTVKSPRTRYDRDLIKHKHKFCTINANILSDGEEYILDVQVIGSEKFENASVKKVKVNRVAKSHRSFNTMFNAVLFMPEDIRILTGSPSKRRHYMDFTLAQIDYTYKKAHTNYLKALRQRNKLLHIIRETGRGHNQIEFWNEKLVQNGQYIQNKRQEMMDFFGKAMKTNGNNILKNGNEIKLEYLKNEIGYKRMAKYRNKELGAGTTLIGPHRDDFEISLGGHPISQFGSRGQQRSVLLALKLAEIEFIEKVIGEKPVLLLDDIFSELDDMHKKQVTKTITQQQTIITSTNVLDELENVKITYTN